MDVFSDKITSKNINFFQCKKCDFLCSKKGDWTRHLATAKHQKQAVGDAWKHFGDAKNITTFYSCEYCDKTYESRNGLWKHRKICNANSRNFVQYCNTDSAQPITPEIVIKVIEQNKELQQILLEQNKTIMELAKKSGDQYIHNTNSNNKTFNLQIFLNETCKDAINLTDFVNQIQLSINDLEETGKLGYAEGISKVFLKNLKDIDLTKRPIHCSDSKRETLYIKDEDKWSKEDEQKSNLTKAIKQVANKNIRKISDWQQLYPKYSDPESKQNDQYMKIVLNSMSGSTKEESDKNYERIIKNIAKETMIEKN